MKKTLAILIALAMVVSAASAQVVIKGSLKIGFGVVMGEDLLGTDVDPAVGYWTDNVANPKFNWFGKDADETQANVSFSYTNGPAGMKVNLRAVNWGSYNTDVSYVWLDLLDKKLKVIFGKGEDNTFRVGTFVQPDVDGKNNLTFILKPVDGLSVGAYMDLPTPKKDTPDDNTFTAQQFLYSTGIGVKYATDMFSVTAGYKGQKAGADTFTGFSENGYIGLAYLGMKNLTANTYAHFQNYRKEDGLVIQSETNLAYMVTETLKIGTYVGVLTASKAAQDASDAQMELYFLPNVTYSLSPSSALALEVYYSMNEDNTKDLTQLYVEPRYTYTVSDNAKVTGYVNWLKQDDGTTDGSATLIGVDFLYSF